MLLNKLQHITGFIRADDGLAASEFALIFPVMLTMLLSTIDIGHGLLVNKKAIVASQIAADLLGREIAISNDELDDAIQAAELSMHPYNITNFGIDVASVRYDSDGDPVIEWRETENMDPLNDVETRSQSLGNAGEGVLFVTVQYLYEPVFSGFVIGNIEMQETGVVRGRRNAYIPRE
jgi:Flp pilus assembly protein TadG